MRIGAAVGLFIIIVIVAIIGSVINSNRTTEPDSSSLGNLPEAKTESLGNSAATTKIEVNISNSTYSNTDITMPVGGEVTFNNTDNIVHTVTEDRGAFDSGDLQPGQSWSKVFDEAGTFSFHCKYHPNIVGTITIK